MTDSGRRIDPAPYFPFSDGFRAVAIFTVFLGHLSAIGPQIGHRVGASVFLTPFDGVSMLFVLSGFLISGPYIKAYLSDGDAFPTSSAYALARFLRIYPLYFVAVAAITLFDIVRHAAPSAWDVVSHVFFLQNTSAATSQTVSGPLWTMAVDVQFYIALPLVFWLLYRSTRTAAVETRIRYLYATLAAICVASVAYRFLATLIFHPATLETGIVYIRQLPGMACVFAAGIAARLVSATLDRRHGDVVASRAWLIIAGALVLQAVNLSLHLHRVHELAAAHFRSAALIWSVEDLLNAAGCTAFLLVANFAPSNGMTRVLSTRTFAFAASLSYAFYLFHLPVIDALVGNAYQPGWGLLARTAVLSLAILVPLCWLLFRGIEDPFLKMKSRLRRSGRAAVPDVNAMRQERFETQNV